MIVSHKMRVVWTCVSIFFEIMFAFYVMIPYRSMDITCNTWYRNQKVCWTNNGTSSKVGSLEQKRRIYEKSLFTGAVLILTCTLDVNVSVIGYILKANYIPCVQLEKWNHDRSINIDTYLKIEIREWCLGRGQFYYEL